MVLSRAGGTLSSAPQQAWSFPSSDPGIYQVCFCLGAFALAVHGPRWYGVPPENPWSAAVSKRGISHSWAVGLGEWLTPPPPNIHFLIGEVEPVFGSWCLPDGKHLDPKCRGTLGFSCVCVCAPTPSGSCLPVTHRGLSYPRGLRSLSCHCVLSPSFSFF